MRYSCESSLQPDCTSAVGSGSSARANFGNERGTISSQPRSIRHRKNRSGKSPSSPKLKSTSQNSLEPQNTFFYCSLFHFLLLKVRWPELTLVSRISKRDWMSYKSKLNSVLKFYLKLSGYLTRIVNLWTSAVSCMW